MESTISVVSSKALLTLFGTCDQHLRRVRNALGVSITARDDRIHIVGPEPAVASATEVLEQLQACATRDGTLSADDVNRVLAGVQNGDSPGTQTPPVEIFRAGRQIRPRTPGQARYLDAIRQNDIVLCYGPAGTGKTYLAVAMAVAALKRESIRKIVLVRPAVEAGESLGFLPGDLQAKINPYLRPLLDALHEMMDHDQIKRYTRRGPDRGDSVGLHAGPHAQRSLHHPRRSPEHHRFADEDVPHAHGGRIEDRRLRRRDADRPAAEQRGAA